MEYLKAQELSSSSHHKQQENRRTRIFLRNGRNSHSLKYDILTVCVLVFSMLIHMRSLVPPLVDAIHLHHTSKVLDLFISFLLAPGKLLRLFTSILFLIAFLSDLSRETHSRHRGLACLGKFFEMGEHLSSISYLLR